MGNFSIQNTHGMLTLLLDTLHISINLTITFSATTWQGDFQTVYDQRTRVVD